MKNWGGFWRFANEVRFYQLPPVKWGSLLIPITKIVISTGNQWQIICYGKQIPWIILYTLRSGNVNDIYFSNKRGFLYCICTSVRLNIFSNACLKQRSKYSLLYPIHFVFRSNQWLKQKYPASWSSFLYNYSDFVFLKFFRGL
jgi:hypothetical protein